MKKVKDNKIILISFVLILGIIILLIPFPYIIQESYTQEELVQDCVERPYEYSMSIENEMHRAKLLEVTIEIKNMEEVSSSFVARAYFFDERTHPESKRHDYTKEDADAVSINHLIELLPYETESRIIRHYLEKPEADNYRWQIVEVTPYNFEDCEFEKTNVTKEKPVTKYASLFKQWIIK